jgi:hypothetical protein
MGMADAVRTVRNAAIGVREGLYAPPGHFLSPLPSTEDIRRGVTWSHSGADLVGVDLEQDQQLQLFAAIGPRLAELPQDLRYTAEAPNRMYPLADAAIYSAMIRRTIPSHIVEVGSGYSSAVALDAADRWNLSTRFTFIEPYPERLLGLLTPADQQRVHLRTEPVQDTPLTTFATMEPGDIMFIDSSHVAKTGSDVLWLFTRVLPIVPPGVLVHVHDIFWPFEYPETWLDERRAWNENYFLHTFLVLNKAYRIRLFNDWLWQAHPHLAEQYLPGTSAVRPGGIWLERAAATP